MPFRALSFHRPIADSRAYISLAFARYYALGYHTGDDYLLREDSIAHCPVEAVAWGTVTFAQRVVVSGYRVWGNLVVIRHELADGSTVYSRSAHVENMRVRAGQVVHPGQHIADVGNAFGAYPYHLHFDISKTDVLARLPWDWPGGNLDRLYVDYHDPDLFIRRHTMPTDWTVLDAAIANSEAAVLDVKEAAAALKAAEQPPVPSMTMYTNATWGLRVRVSAPDGEIIGSLPYRSEVKVYASTTPGWYVLAEEPTGDGIIKTRDLRGSLVSGDYLQPERP